MAGTAIRQLGQLFRIIRGPISMAVQTPAHVHHLGIFGDLDVGHIAVTFFSVQSRCNVRPVRKVDEIRHHGNGHPGDLLILQHILLQDGQPGAGIRLGDLLMAAPALGLRWQTRRWSAQGSRVAVQALHT